MEIVSIESDQNYKNAGDDDDDEDGGDGGGGSDEDDFNEGDSDGDNVDVFEMADEIYNNQTFDGELDNVSQHDNLSKDGDAEKGGVGNEGNDGGGGGGDDGGNGGGDDGGGKKPKAKTKQKANAGDDDSDGDDNVNNNGDNEGNNKKTQKNSDDDDDEADDEKASNCSGNQNADLRTNIKKGRFSDSSNGDNQKMEEDIIVGEAIRRTYSEAHNRFDVENNNNNDYEKHDPLTLRDLNQADYFWSNTDNIRESRQVDDGGYAYNNPDTGNNQSYNYNNYENQNNNFDNNLNDFNNENDDCGDECNEDYLYDRNDYENNYYEENYYQEDADDDEHRGDLNFENCEYEIDEREENWVWFWTFFFEFLEDHFQNTCIFSFISFQISLVKNASSSSKK